MSDLPAISLSHRIQLAETVLMEDLAGEAILLDLASEEYFALNELGTRMLRVVEDSASIAAALETLEAEYEVEFSVLQQDLVDYLEQLLHNGLVEIVAA